MMGNLVFSTDVYLSDVPSAGFVFLVFRSKMLMIKVPIIPQGVKFAPLLDVNKTCMTFVLFCGNCSSFLSCVGTWEEVNRDVCL